MNSVPFIKGYRTGGEIASSRFFGFYRAFREADSLPVLLRIPVNGFCGKTAMEMLERDFFLTGNSSVKGAVPVLAVEKYGDSAVTVMADPGWIPLLSLPDDNNGFVCAAVEMARTLSLVHASGIVYRNLNSSSFLFLKGEKLKCSITGFEHSARIAHADEKGKPVPRSELELGTASPETLGLIPFPPDCRSDLYSLGIIFYEMFTGVKPFICSDESDLIYAHIAMEPAPPSTVSGRISSRVSDIVLKLLLKDPESRYQTAAELLNDLESCAGMCGGFSPEHRVQTLTWVPLFTDRIYGRENEFQKCHEISEAAAHGMARIILTGGPPGSGKTSFITRLMEVTGRRAGLQGSSKDNRHGSNIPYSGIAGAFGRVIRQILTRGDREIEMWREKFTKALGPNLPVISEVIPEFEIITGPQQEQSCAGDIEARNRFIFSFRLFAQTLALESGLLVLFLDDIQWSDRAGLDLVTSLVADPDLKHVLIICAFRDNEISGNDALNLFLDEMKSRPDRADFIKIGGLPQETAAEMIEDILQIRRGICPELCDYIFRKTAGNPYYIREYIKTVFSKGLLKVSPDGIPEYDTGSMDRLPASDSLASVLNSAMVNLDRDMKNVLAAGACAGWAFSPHLVSVILRIPVSSVNAYLDNLEKEGYIVKVDENYRFVHDRVRETAYELIPEQERLAIHRRSGRLLYGMASDDGEMYYSVEQMNLAFKIITGTAERIDLACLNLEAGMMSLKKAAFASALNYLRAACGFLPENSWDTRYELTADILRELARCESLNGNILKAETIIMESLKHIKTDQERAGFLEILIHQLNITGNLLDSLNYSRYALSLLGIEIPLNSIEGETRREMDILKNYLERNGLESLLKLPENRDSISQLTMNIIWEMSHATYFTDAPLTVYLSVKLMNLSISHGLCCQTISACCEYIVIVAVFFEDYETAFRLWEVTEEIMQRLNAPYYKSQIYNKVANYLLPMIKHLRESEPVNMTGYNAGCVSGEHLCSGYSIAHKVVNSFHYGRGLKEIRNDIIEHLPFCVQTNNDVASKVMILLSGIAGYLSEISPDAAEPGRRVLTEGEKTALERIQGNDVLFSQAMIFDLQAFFIMGEYGRCLEIIDRIKDRVQALKGLFTATEFNFYHSLSLTSLTPGTDETKIRTFRFEINRNQLELKKWADRCPENFLHKYLLVEAEISRLELRTSDALNLYDRAIESARENRFIQNEALCNELAARFWLSQGKEEFAGIYLRNARRLYSEWGAVRKVAMLDRIFPELISSGNRLSGYAAGDTDIINRDIAAVVRSLHAISGEIELESLLHTLVRNILQFSGATRLVLMMVKNGTICAEAEGALNRSDGAIKSEILQSVPVESFTELPAGVARYCWRTGKTVIVNDATAEELFIDDPYVASGIPKSYICVKNNYGDTSVLAYLENSLARYAFTSGKVEILKLIAVQAAISLENARLYLEKKESLKKLAELGEVRDRLIRQYEEAHQSALQKRMDPHFLYNAVHTIHSLININPAEADRAVLLLGEMFHFFTDRSFESLVQLSDEWRFTQLYLEFEKIRFPDTLWFILDKNFSFEGIMIPPLTIQPLVENAIKHGLRKKAGGGAVNISAVREGEFVVIEVTDTGTCLNSDDLYSRSLGNILNRLKYNFDFADVTLCNNVQGGVKATVKFSVRK